MKLKNDIITLLKQNLKEGHILTDVEDCYVYSFEKIFLDPAYPKPDVVVRIGSLKEEKDVMDLLEKENVTVIKRGEVFSRPLEKSTNLIILIDNVNIPLLSCNSERIREKENFIAEGYGSYRNLAIAVKNLFFEKTLNKCQQCDICSGYCTVSPSFDGIETMSSKGRMLLARGIMKGDLNLSEKVIDSLYACTKCGLCFAQCFQDLEFHEAILHLRHKIAEHNKVPQVFQIAATNIIEHGDPSATTMDRRLIRIRNFNKLDFPETADTLCFLGCTTATRTPKTAEALFNILTRSNIEFTTLGKNEGCCGYILISTGLWKEAKEVANIYIKKIEKAKVKTIITPCSGCYYTFAKLYPEILGITIPCEILHSSQFLEDIINKGEIKLNPLNLNVTYHDPCSLGRHSQIYDPPRNVLKAIPNLKLVEMPLNRSCTRCCGGGGGLWTFNNNVSLETTQTRLKEDLIPIDVNVLATACPQCQLNFRFASRMKDFPNKSLKIYDIVELFESAM